MNRTTRLSLALGAALLALPMLASAQEEEGDDSGFSWNAALTSDYVFRGVSQTDEDPALQLGLDYSWSSGFYVGAWASNVDFGAGGPDIEIDTYVGWNTDLNDSLNLDLMLNRYNYTGADSGYGSSNYTEFLAALAVNEMITFSFGYTNDVYNLDEDGFYYGIGGEWGLGEHWTLGAGVGYSTFDDSTGIEDYTDYSLSVGRDFGPVNISLGYHGTDSNGEWNFGDTADDRVVLTFSIEG